MALELGRLENVSIRDVWLSEPTDFTPWLLANADLLSEAIGINLTLTAAEHPVGSFSLDLIGEDEAGDVVIVENQLEQTDHTHLGQIMTYWAGTGASTVVWVSPRFREEHKRALVILNDSTTSDISFFGVEVSAVRIGNSLVAPRFVTVVAPSTWGRATKASTTKAKSVVSDKTTEMKLRFWDNAVRGMIEAGVAEPNTDSIEMSKYTGLVIQSLNSSVRFCVGRFGTNKLYSTIEVRYNKSNRVTAEFTRLMRLNLDAINEKLGNFDAEVFDANTNSCARLNLEMTGKLSDESRWPEYIDWFIASQIELRRVLNELGLIEQIEALGTDETPAAA